MLLELMKWYAHIITMAPRLVFRAIFPETPRPADYFWSRWDTIFQPVVRLDDGTWSGNGVMWRRRRQEDDRWEYRQDEETLEEQMDRII